LSTQVFPTKSAQTATPASKLEWLSLKLHQPQAWLRISAILVTALYLRTIAFGFVYDDLGIVFIQWKGWKGLGSLFFRDLFASADGPGSSYYRPLAQAWGFIYYHWTGGTPGWFHLGAVITHLVVFYLAYVFGRYLFRSEWTALLTALLFSLHPSKVESVAWIGSAWCDAFGAIFFFGSLIGYFKWRESGRAAWLAESVVLFAACLFTKETLAVLPGLIAIHFWLSEPSPGRFRKSTLLLIPYALALAVYFVLRHIALTPHVVHTVVAVPYLKPSFTMTNLWSAPLAFWWYLKHLVWPTGLAVMYDSIIVTTPSFWNFVVPAIGLVAAVVAGAWLWWRHRSLQVTLNIAFFALTLAPYIVLAPMSQQHDRYLYLSCYPFATMLAWLLLKPTRVLPRVRVSIGLLLVALWSASTWHETSFWQDNLSLWQRASEVAPAEVRPKVELAEEYALAGNIRAAKQTVAEGLRLHPQSPHLLFSRAALMERDGDLATAKSIFETAFAVDQVGNLKPICASRIGNIDMQQKDYADAERWYRTAVTLAPAVPAYHGALAKALRAQRREAEAREQDLLAREAAIAIRNSASSL
jgi:protein O-mannosyl-transferase